MSGMNKLCSDLGDKSKLYGALSGTDELYSNLGGKSGMGGPCSSLGSRMNFVIT